MRTPVTTDTVSLASDADTARTRALNDRLRTTGQGGAIVLSLGLHLSGDDIIEQALRMVAGDRPTSALHDSGRVANAAFDLEWRIVWFAPGAASTAIPVLIVMFANELGDPQLYQFP